MNMFARRDAVKYPQLHDLATRTFSVL